MGEVNAELATTMAGRRVKDEEAVYAWETCTAAEFERYWLPMFEKRLMQPNEAPVITTLRRIDNDYGYKPISEPTDFTPKGDELISQPKIEPLIDDRLGYFAKGVHSRRAFTKAMREQQGIELHRISNVKVLAEGDGYVTVWVWHRFESRPEAASLTNCNGSS